ncbi:MAG: flagellar hook assembly protein FlgD [Lysobacteraceae bacterium]
MNVNPANWSEMGLAQPNRQRDTSLGQADFLRLMTEQLKNQDPLKPLESNEFLGQMAQFSTVQGIQDLQTHMQNMLFAIQDDQSLKAADMIGRDVQIAADRFTLGEEGLRGQVALPSAGDVTVEIKSSSGEVVHRVTFPAQEAGLKEFRWDGLLADGEPAPHGEYRIEARVNTGTRSEPAATLVSARVESVSFSQYGVILNLAGLGPVPISAVQHIG